MKFNRYLANDEWSFAGAKALGGCRSLGCRGYLRALLNARISLWTTTRFHRHLPQTHLLAMSLTKIQPPLPLQKKKIPI